MEIRVSDIIWTIICFGLFTLVLNGLLIKPVLKLMDERRAKISGAKEKAQAIKAAEAEAKERAMIEAAEAARLREEENARLLSETSEYAKEELRLLSDKLREEEADELERIASEASRCDGELFSAMDRMVEAFTGKLISGGES